MLSLATRILKDYGRCLAEVEPGSYGLPQSFLPYSKDKIAEAHRVTLIELGQERPELREALIRGYVYLQQFVSDDEAQQIADAHELLDPFGNPDATAATDENRAALELVNRIKLAMEQALETARIWSLEAGDGSLAATATRSGITTT
jgi:hypothetical protein